MDIDPHLIEEIRSGNCVAFVGAGFAAPAVPNWDDLLRRISDKDGVPEETKKRVDSLLIQSEREQVHVLRSNSSWFGVTYKEDKPYVMVEIEKLINAGAYPLKLFE